MFRRVETRDSYAEKNLEQRKSLMTVPADKGNLYPAIDQYAYNQPYVAQNEQPKRGQVLFQGDVYHQRSGWEVVAGATVTADRFINFDIHSISKVKVKRDVALPHTRILKLCTPRD